MPSFITSSSTRPRRGRPTPEAARPSERNHSPYLPMSHDLIVLPDDSATPIVEALNAAKRVVQIRMFLFTDPTMLNTVVAARKRGVVVRVMLNPARRDGTSDNDDTRKKLVAAGIEVRDSNPDF